MARGFGSSGTRLQQGTIALLLLFSDRVGLVLSTSATFGQILNTAGSRGGAREIEIALRYEF